MGDLALPPSSEWGPKLRALKNDQQRLFVLALADGGNPTLAARRAGYSDKSQGCKIRAHFLMHNEDVLAALHEVAWKRLNGISLRAVASLERVVDDPEHPKHLQAVEMVLDRTGFGAQTEHKVTVEHKVNDLQMKALAARFAQEYGVPAAKLLGEGEVIEGEAVDVSHETEGL